MALKCHGGGGVIRKKCFKSLHWRDEMKSLRNSALEETMIIRPLIVVPFLKTAFQKNSPCSSVFWLTRTSVTFSHFIVSEAQFPHLQIGKKDLFDDVSRKINELRRKSPKCVFCRLREGDGFALGPYKEKWAFLLGLSCRFLEEWLRQKA